MGIAGQSKWVDNKRRQDVSQILSLTNGTVEDAPSGYPRDAALLSTNSSFYVYRRFLRLRARLLLYKQDSLITLEEELDQIDRNEPKVLFLGNQRRDKNNERKIVMKMIEHGLTDYGKFVRSWGMELYVMTAEIFQMPW